MKVKTKIGVALLVLGLFLTSHYHTLLRKKLIEVTSDKHYMCTQVK
jgi:hypothetical protein